MLTSSGYVLSLNNQKVHIFNFFFLREGKVLASQFSYLVDGLRKQKKTI